MRNANVLSGALVVCALLVGYAAAGALGGRPAHAQADGQSRGVIAVMGEVRDRGAQAPIIICDTVEQTMMVYLYDYRNEDLEFVSARSFRFDKLLQEFNNDGRSVEDVEREVTR
jgi:hypothetical protein